MQQRTISLKTKADGSFVIDTEGYTGNACALDAQALADRLGSGKIDVQVLKPEAYETQEIPLSN